MNKLIVIGLSTIALSSPSSAQHGDGNPQAAAAAVIGGGHALCFPRWNIWQGCRLAYPVPQPRREDGAWQ
jgi:hypothetical protein